MMRGLLYALLNGAMNNPVLQCFCDTARLDFHRLGEDGIAVLVVDDEGVIIRLTEWSDE